MGDSGRERSGSSETDIVRDSQPRLEPVVGEKEGNSDDETLLLYLPPGSNSKETEGSPPIAGNTSGKVTVSTMVASETISETAIKSLTC